MREHLQSNTLLSPEWLRPRVLLKNKGKCYVVFRCFQDSLGFFRIVPIGKPLQVCMFVLIFVLILCNGLVPEHSLTLGSRLDSAFGFVLRRYDRDPNVSVHIRDLAGICIRLCASQTRPRSKCECPHSDRSWDLHSASCSAGTTAIRM